MNAVRARSSEEILSLFVIEENEQVGSIDAFLHRMMDRCAEWFEAGGVSVFLEDGSPNQFLLAAQSGPFAKIPGGTILKSGEGIAGAAVKDGRPMLLQGLAKGKGSRKIGSSMIVPLVDVRRRCVGVLNLARGEKDRQFDTADLKLAETLGQHIALAVSNARLFSESKHLSEMLRATLTHVGFGLISVDPEARITHFNPELAMLLGAVPVINETVMSLIQRSNEEIGLAADLALAHSLNGKRYRKRAAIGNRVLTFSATALPSGGATLAIQDVTELEHAQREHERLKRLAEVGQMTATIAHEIRNPLTGVRSAAKMIKDSPELAQEFAEIIEDESIKLARLCDEFLEFARPLKLECARADLGEIVTHVCKTLQDTFDENGVTLRLELDAKSPKIELDSRRMEQVIRNLLLNALQATPTGGSVTAQTMPAHLVIKDTGCGMDPDTVQRLFSPFFTTKPKGTGLGLTMVRKIIDAHEGHIEVQSTPGLGTRFEIRFHQEHSL